MAAQHAGTTGETIEDQRERLSARLAASRGEIARAAIVAKSAARHAADWRSHLRVTVRRHPLAITGVVAFAGYFLARGLRGGPRRGKSTPLPEPPRVKGPGILAALASTAYLITKPALIKAGSRAVENWLAARDIPGR